LIVGGLLVDFPRKLLQCKTSRKYHVCGNSGLSRFYLRSLSRRSERRKTSRPLHTSGNSGLFPASVPQPFPKATTPHFCQRPPPLRGDGQLRQSFPSFPRQPIPRFWFPGFCSAAFLQNPQPRILPQTRNPSGQPPNCRRVFPKPQPAFPQRTPTPAFVNRKRITGFLKYALQQASEKPPQLRKPAVFARHRGSCGLLPAQGQLT